MKPASLGIAAWPTVPRGIEWKQGVCDALGVEAVRYVATSAARDARNAGQFVDGASAFSYPLIFLPFISSAFVLTAAMPGPVRAFAENQPVTPIVNTIRDLYTQHPVSADIWIALAWCVAILLVGYGVAIATYHRKIA